MQVHPWLAVVAPAYNEQDVIKQVVTQWSDVLSREKLSFEIVICNDGSSDRTPEILSELQQSLPHLVVVSHFPNRGYGYALAQAIKASTADYIMTMDSDGQFDIAEYANLLQALSETKSDLVTGFRLAKKDSFLKVTADRIMNILVRCLFGLSLRDTNCAQKLAKGDILRSLVIEATGYPTPTEIVLKAHAQGYTVSERGVPHLFREAGRSKLNFCRTSIKFLVFLLYLRLRICLWRSRISQFL